jgi:quinol monooxygenase YgiN
MTNETLYCVRFWVSPEGREQLLNWLDHSHMQDVVSQPGFLWMKRLKLAQDADDGWLAYMMIYSVESQAALHAYFDSPATARFAAERKPFEHHLRMERCWGDVDHAIGG